MSFTELSNLMLDPTSPLSWLTFILLLAIGLIVSSLGRESNVWYGPFIGAMYLFSLAGILWPLNFGPHPLLVYYSIFDGISAALLLMAWGLHYMGFKL